MILYRKRTLRLRCPFSVCLFIFSEDPGERKSLTVCQKRTAEKYKKDTEKRVDIKSRRTVCVGFESASSTAFLSVLLIGFSKRAFSAKAYIRERTYKAVQNVRSTSTAFPIHVFICSQKAK